MGQRGAKAAFMPSKYVFPGGAVDPADNGVTLVEGLAAGCATRLVLFPTSQASPETLAAAGIRELWEETGLALGTPGEWQTPPEDAGPSASGMRFVFRAITPPGRPRRFDARFFLVPATRIAGDPEDFSAASDELTHLHWIGLDRVRGLDLPFITEVVLAEVSSILGDQQTQPGVPFFDNSGATPLFRRLV